MIFMDINELKEMPEPTKVGTKITFDCWRHGKGQVATLAEEGWSGFCGLRENPLDFLDWLGVISKIDTGYPGDSIVIEEPEPETERLLCINPGPAGNELRAGVVYEVTRRYTGLMSGLVDVTGDGTSTCVFDHRFVPVLKQGDLKVGDRVQLPETGWKATGPDRNYPYFVMDPQLGMTGTVVECCEGTRGIRIHVDGATGNIEDYRWPIEVLRKVDEPEEVATPEVAVADEVAPLIEKYGANAVREAVCETEAKAEKDKLLEELAGSSVISYALSYLSPATALNVLRLEDGQWVDSDGDRYDDDEDLIDTIFNYGNGEFNVLA